MLMQSNIISHLSGLVGSAALCRCALLRTPPSPIAFGHHITLHMAYACVVSGRNLQPLFNKYTIKSTVAGAVPAPIRAGKCVYNSPPDHYRCSQVDGCTSLTP